MMKVLARFPVIAIPVIVAILTTPLAGASTLYQWTAEDGTPTYSPEPPPKGVSFVVVGPDLRPIQGQPAAQPQTPVAQNPQAPRAPQAAVASRLPVPARKADVVMTPPPTGNKTAQAPSKPKTQWKPVKYADDPNPGANKPVFSSRTPASANNNSQVATLSEECLTIRQKLLELEGQFANAKTAKEMDQAVLKLSSYRNQTKGRCDN